MSPRAVDRQAKRGEIIETAICVFASKGYAATRVSDVARAAGVAQGTIYLYFGSREEILAAAFEAFATRLEADVAAVVDRQEPALDRLRSLVRAVLDGMSARPELARVMRDFLVASGTATAIDLGAVYARYREVVAGLLAGGQRDGSVRTDLPAGTPAVVVGAIEGAYLQWVVDPRAASPAELAQPLVDVLLDGIRGVRAGGAR